jgi:hypothetical protein
LPGTVEGDVPGDGQEDAEIQGGREQGAVADPGRPSW